MYKSDRAGFNAKAKHWCEMYAQDGSPQQVGKIKIITDMGFSEDEARSALAQCDWKEEEALNKLLG